MVFIVGGREQGKEAFARRQFPILENKKPIDGRTASWEEFLTAFYGINLQEIIRRRLAEGESPETLEKNMAKELMDSCQDRVLLVDEVGSGIVPVDEFLRSYREIVGRICCQLAKEAKEVWRVTAGIGQRIK